MKKLVFSTLLLVLVNFAAKAQSANTVTVGLGLGLEYGGFGGQVGYQIDDQFGAFLGFGTAFVSSGYNVGLKYLLDGKSREQFFLEAMYGYNAIIFADFPSGGNVRNVYFGPSVGGGINLPNKGGNSFWHIAVLVPFRSSAYRNQWNAIKNDPDIDAAFSLPFSVSIGINFKL